MNHSLDTGTLALLEEHVRQLLGTMGFSEVTVHCRVKLALPTTGGETKEQEEEAWLGNAALKPVRRREVGRKIVPRDELFITLEAGEAGKLLIGGQGAHLEALQHILRSILRRTLETPIHILVDVNGYRARREQGLLEMAEAAAARARQAGRTITLAPMSASDRRAVHAALAARGDVHTESVGEEPNRRVVVRPVF